MSYITIDEQQVRILLESSGTIEVRDRDGNKLGYVSRSFSADEVADARRRLASAGPWYTTEQVLNHLSSLRAK